MPLDTSLALVLAAASFVACHSRLRAPRARRWAAAGLVLATAAAAGLAADWALGSPAARRAGWMLALLGAACAHVAVLRVAPVRQGAEGARGALLVAGAGALSLAAVAGGARSGLPFFLVVLAVWGLALHLARRPPNVVREGRSVPCARFACPRCGTLADWGAGGFPCPVCGLFVHADWGAEAGGAEPAPEVGPGLVVRCPGCGARARRPAGTSPCASCGLFLRLSWNVHRGPLE